MSAHGSAQRALLLRVSLGLASTGCAKPQPQAPPPSLAEVAPRAARFLGCWMLEMPDSLDELGMSNQLTVQLDSAVIGRNGTEVALRAVALRGFQGRRAPAEPRLTWWLHERTDTLELATQSLSGASWRLAPSGDSLVGQTYLFFDLGPGESLVGPAWARRTTCNA